MGALFLLSHPPKVAEWFYNRNRSIVNSYRWGWTYLFFSFALRRVNQAVASINAGSRNPSAQRWSGSDVGVRRPTQNKTLPLDFRLHRGRLEPQVIYCLS